MSREAFPVEQLIEEAYQEARKHQPAETAQLKYENGGKPIVITGDRAALKHALAEIMLNALQANPTDAENRRALADRIQRRRRARTCRLKCRTTAPVSPPKPPQKVPSPFFTTRNVGLGLGLTVSRKIIETHHGKLEIVPPKTGQHGIVRVPCRWSRAFHGDLSQLKRKTKYAS